MLINTREVSVKEVCDVPSINLALDTIDMNKQALIFVNTKAGAEKTAEEISKKIKDTNLAILSGKVLNALSRPTKQCERLSRCIKRGVAFHHAGLTQKQKSLIEDNFRLGKIKIIACTPSLAMGVDLPAFRAIIRDVKRFTRQGLVYIPVLEYLQMAGRAGRPKYDKEGEAIIVANTEIQEEDVLEKYINGKPEKIYSKLAVEPVLRTYLLSLIAGNFVRKKSQIMDFFSKTFYAHQYGDMHALEGKIEKMLAMLIDFEFLLCSADEFSSADKLDDVKYRATKVGSRVAELYLDPLTAHNMINAMKRAKEKITTSFSYLQLVCFTNELRPLLRVKMKEYDDIIHELVKYEDDLIVYEPSAFETEYDDFLNSVKTALFFNDWTEEKDEEFLLEKYSIRPGEIRTKLALADWLLYSALELSKLLSYRDVSKQLVKVRMRLKYGVKEELLPLLKLKQVGRVRARAMYGRGIRNIGDVKKTDTAKLGLIIKSRKIAESIKEDLGQKVEKVKRGKRKGQLSLNK